jgi:hypothetical protein
MVLAGASSTHASVLRTCKALHRVDVEVLYSQATFDFGRRLDLTKPWLAQIGFCNFRFVRSLAFVIALGSNPTASEELEYTRQLHSIFEHLSTHCDISTRRRLTLSFEESTPTNAILSSDMLISRIVTVKALAALSSTATLIVNNLRLPAIFLHYLLFKSGLRIQLRHSPHGPQSHIKYILTDVAARVLALEKHARKRQGKEPRTAEASASLP